MKMAGLSLSEQLRLLSDPRPAEFNPDEEDWELLSGTRIGQARSYGDQGTRGGGVVSGRVGRREEGEGRYAGRAVSRSELFGDDGK